MTIAVSPLQIVYRARREPVVRDPATFVQGSLLRDRAMPPGYVWGFGGDPEIYYYWRQPIVMPDRTVAMPKGDPDAFVAALREAGFRYLTFVVRRAAPDTAENATEPQPLAAPPDQPLRRDLLALADAPERHALRLLGTATAEQSTRQVYLFELRDPSLARQPLAD
jgi:hypothetical protein